MPVKRTDLILERVSGKRVLDVGCVDHDNEYARTPDDLHQQIAEEADYTLGIDVLDESVERMQEEGYNVVVADIQSLDLDEVFDVIVLGEVIEHLVDFDGLLTSLESHLAPNGRIIITTPNAMSILYSIRRLVSGEFANTTHTTWFDSQTIKQLFARYGFEPVDIWFAMETAFEVDPVWSFVWLGEFVLPPELGRRTLVAEFKQESDESLV